MSMDTERIFYGIGKRKKRRGIRTNFFLAAIVFLAGFILANGLFYEKWFWESDDISRQLVVRNVESRWISTKRGFLFFVRGEVMNEAEVPVSYLKLRSTFRLSGRDLGTQEFYSGNTLSQRDLKNADVDYMLRKLARKGGDELAGFEDVAVSANFDVKPGNSVPFYTFYLAGTKILGVKYEIEILDFEVMPDG